MNSVREIESHDHRRFLYRNSWVGSTSCYAYVGAPTASRCMLDRPCRLILSVVRPGRSQRQTRTYPQLAISATTLESSCRKHHSLAAFSGVTSIVLAWGAAESNRSSGL
jgi:hypothetical protein